MALPTTITGISTAIACVGPFISSAGNVYFFGRSSSDTTRLDLTKATDPTSSFSSVANFSNASLEQIEYLSGRQNGDTIHAAMCFSTAGGTNANYRYFTIDLSADTISSRESIVTNINTATSGAVAQYGISIVLRSGGEVVVFFNGAQVANMGNSYAQTYYSRRTGVNTWSAATQVSAGGQVDFTLPEALLGASDRVHFHHKASTGNGFVERSLSSANSLDTEQTLSQTVTSNQGISYDSGGGTIHIAIPTFSGDEHFIKYDSGANPSLATGSGIGSGLTVPQRAYNDGTTIYVVVRDGSSDLTLYSSTDGGTSISLTASGFFTATIGAVDANLSIDGNIFTRGSSVVIPYVVNDNGTLKYNEYVVRTITGSAAPNGWLGQLNRAPAAIALPIAAAMTWCPQPITPPAPTPSTLDWQAELSVAPPIVNVARTFAFAPWDTAQIQPPASTLAWQPPLSVAPSIVKTRPGFAFVPFDTVQPTTAPPVGWQSPLSIAPQRASVPYSQPQLVPRDNPQTSLGWQPQLSIAPAQAVVRGSSSLTFVVAPFAVPQGWQQPLSVAPPATARTGVINQPLPYYPVVVAPDNTVTLDKWQRPLASAPPIIPATAGFSYVPFDTAQTVAAPATLAWQQPLSAAPPIARAPPGFAYVPFDTPQAAVQIASYGWLSALSAAPQRQALGSQGFASVPFAPPPIISVAWQQPLSVAPQTAKTAPGSSGAYAPLAPAQQVVSLAWQSPLSSAPRPAQAPQSVAIVPFNTPQPTPAGIAGMAWFYPLSIAVKGTVYPPSQFASWTPAPPPTSATSATYNDYIVRARRRGRR